VLQQYLYHQKKKVLLAYFPEIQSILKEICQKNYSSSLPIDEIIFIESKISEDEVSILFSTKALINNLIEQSKLQPSFIHIDLQTD